MQKVRVLAVASFENVRKGDTGLVDLTPRIKGIIKLGYLRVVEDVPLPDRPSSDSRGKPGGSKERTDNGVQAGAEPSKAPDAG